MVSARVDSLGRLMDAKVDVLDSLQRRGGAGRSPQIVEAAEACVRRWKFRPGLKNGRSVECHIGVVVHFAPPTSDNPVAPGKRR